MVDESKRKATERAEQIRLGLQQTALLYTQALTEGDWHTLGYRSIDDWRRGEFGPDRFSRERRQEIVSLLTQQNWTQREIAKATGASQAQVMRDQHQAGEPNGSPALTPPGSDPTGLTAPAPSPRQQAAIGREQRRQAAARRRVEMFAGGSGSSTVIPSEGGYGGPGSRHLVQGPRPGQLPGGSGRTDDIMTAIDNTLRDTPFHKVMFSAQEILDMTREAGNLLDFQHRFTEAAEQRSRQPRTAERTPA